MSPTFLVRALDALVRIDLDETLSQEEQEFIRARWADLEVDDDGADAVRLRVELGRPEHGLDTPRQILVRGETLDELASNLVTQVSVQAANSIAGSGLILHAAGVALDDGRVIGFVGASGSGKTTVARELGARLGYVTDEVLAVRPDGTVISYAKPLGLDAGSATKRQASASSLGLRALPDAPLRLAALVLLDRVAGADSPQIEDVPLVDAIGELTRQSSYLSQLNRPLQTLIDIIQNSGGVRSVSYTEASQLEAVIDDLLAAASDERVTLTSVASAKGDCDCFPDVYPGAPVKAEVPFAEAPPGSYRRAVHTDAVMFDDYLVLLANQEVTVLAGVGPTVWLAASDTSEDELREIALNELPPPPPGVDAGAIVSATLQQLVDAQLLARR